MKTEFTAIIQTLITEQGKDALFNAARCKAILADYTRGEYKKESRLLSQAIEAGVAKAIAETDDIASCKAQAVRKLEDEYYLAENIAQDVVEMLAFVLAPPQAREAAVEAAPKCAKCGNPLQEGAKFCPNCGAAAGGEAATVVEYMAQNETDWGSEAEAVPPTPQPSASVSAYSETAPAPQTAVAPQAVPSPMPALLRKKHTKRNVLIAVGVVAVLAIIGVISENVENNSSANTTQASSTPNTTQTVTIPGNLRVTQIEASSVSLAWDSVGTGVSYQIYNGTENNPANSQLLGSIDGNVATITQLTAGTAYYFWVTAVKDGKESGKSPVVSAWTAAVPMTYKIGDLGPAGGIIFYDKSNNSDGWRYLETAPAEKESSGGWGYGDERLGTQTAVGTGKQNTRLLIDGLQKRGEAAEVAQLYASLNVNGYKDWFLPSKDELNLMYTNLKKKGLGGFSDGFYWSSSLDSDNCFQDFSSGNQTNYYMGGRDSTRAIRAF